MGSLFCVGNGEPDNDHAQEHTDATPHCRRTGLDESQDLLEKGFQLAFFILCDRSTAIHVVTYALNKLTVQHSREQKRAYWRDKYLKGRITRITRENRDALQWLIYFESESYEKKHEELGQQTLRDMIIRYVKHLVQISTPMSAFYV